MNAAEREVLIERYQQGPTALRSAYDASPAEARQWRPDPSSWSIHEIVVHCADSETSAYARIRMLIAEENPLIVGYDQEEWARRFDYHARPIETAFAVIESIRAHTTELILTFGDAEWARAGTHSERGAYTAETWLDDYGNHLADHVDQIETNLAKWSAKNAA